MSTKSWRNMQVKGGVYDMTEDEKLREELQDFLVQNGLEKWHDPELRESIYVKGTIPVQVWSSYD